MHPSVDFRVSRAMADLSRPATSPVSMLDAQMILQRHNTHLQKPDVILARHKGKLDISASGHQQLSNLQTHSPGPDGEIKMDAETITRYIDDHSPERVWENLGSERQWAGSLKNLYHHMTPEERHEYIGSDEDITTVGLLLQEWVSSFWIAEREKIRLQGKPRNMLKSIVQPNIFEAFTDEAVEWAGTIIERVKNNDLPPRVYILSALIVRLYLIDNYPRRIEDIFSLRTGPTTTYTEGNWVDLDSGDAILNKFKGSEIQRQLGTHEPYHFRFSADTLILCHALVPDYYDQHGSILLSPGPNSMGFPHRQGGPLFRRAFYIATNGRVNDMNVQKLRRLWVRFLYDNGPMYLLEGEDAARRLGHSHKVSYENYLFRDIPVTSDELIIAANMTEEIEDPFADPDEDTVSFSPTVETIDITSDGTASESNHLVMAPPSENNDNEFSDDAGVGFDDADPVWLHPPRVVQSRSPEPPNVAPTRPIKRRRVVDPAEREQRKNLRKLKRQLAERLHPRYYRHTGLAPPYDVIRDCKGAVLDTEIFVVDDNGRQLFAADLFPGELIEQRYVSFFSTIRYMSIWKKTGKRRRNGYADSDSDSENE